jgi:hypothetical protein
MAIEERAMRSTIGLVILTGLALTACGGGGQTEPTQAEESLSNEFQPSAPSPGTVGGGGETGNMVTANQAQAPGNSQ